MKVTKYKKTYRLTINQREADLLMHALGNSSEEDINSGYAETEKEGWEKDKMWNDLRSVAGH